MPHIIDRLLDLHWKYAGESPEYSFWSWIDANGIDPNEEALIDFANEIEKDPSLFFAEDELRQTGYFKEGE